MILFNIAQKQEKFNEKFKIKFEVQRNNVQNKMRVSKVNFATL